MDKIRILLQPEFEYYHSLLTAYGEDLVEKFKQTLLAAKYHESSRILEFGVKSNFDEVLMLTNDGFGNVKAILPSTMIFTDDGQGGIIIEGAQFLDDGKGNVYIS